MKTNGFIARIAFIVTLIVSTMLLDYFYRDLKLDLFFIGLSMLFPLSMHVDRIEDGKMRETFLPIAGQVVFLYIYLLYALPVMFVLSRFIPVNINYIWGIYLILALYSHLNYRNFHVKEYKIKSKKISEDKKIVFFSDIHLNEFSRKKRLENLITEINALDADIVINGGDLIDSYSTFISDEIKACLKKIKFKKAFLGVMGNHEHLGNTGENRKFLKEIGMNLLEEKSYKDNGLVIIGRELFKTERQSIESLKVEKDKFVVNIDHVPSRFDQSVEAGIDLNLSGHTHAGQFFPINFLYKMLYPMIYGYKQLQHMHIIVTSGVGASFIPFRNLNRPEIVFVQLLSEDD